VSSGPLAIAALAVLGVGLLSDAARADVWACKDKEGVVRFADRKLRGFRCVLYAKTPGHPKPDVAVAGPSRAPDRDMVPTAFARDRAAPRYAPIPPAPGEVRFGGDEPEEQAARERLYAPYIEEAARLYDIPEDFVRAVIRVESNFRYRATSSAGAQGLMQLMPSVQREMGVESPWDPRANVLGGTRLLRVLADRFEGDMVKVLAAYHAGSGAVSGAEGIPYEATESYVRSVLDRYYEYRSRSEARLLPDE
jgi:soluble lytic murein transglycosylase-like protein